MDSLVLEAVSPRSSVGRTVLTWRLWEGIHPFSLPASGRVPGILGLWLLPSSVCLCLHMVFFPLCVSVSTDTPAIDLGPTLIQDDLILIGSHLQRFCWPVRSHSQVWGGHERGRLFNVVQGGNGTISPEGLADVRGCEFGWGSSMNLELYQLPRHTDEFIQSWGWLGGHSERSRGQENVPFKQLVLESRLVGQGRGHDTRRLRRGGERPRVVQRGSVGTRTGGDIISEWPL